MFTSLDGSYSPFGGVDVYHEGSQRHEGSPYSPLEISPRRRFPTTSGRPSGGLQTFTNFPGANHKLIPHRSTPTAQESPTSKSNKIKGGFLKTCSNREFLWSKEGEGVDLSMGEISLKNSHKSLRDLGFGVGEEEREPFSVLECFSMKCSTLTRGG